MLAQDVASPSEEKYPNWVAVLQDKAAQHLKAVIGIEQARTWAHSKVAN